MLQILHGSAHDIPIPDQSVGLIVTSPPYYSLRKYSGDQDVEWPTIEYAPMPGLLPIRVQGCESGCEHVWGETMTVRETDGFHRMKWSTGGDPANKRPKEQATQGAYCQHCGGWRGALGLEPTIEMYIGHLVLCLREWHRMLRDDGTAWVNLGDSYAGSGGAHAASHANPGVSNSYKRNGVPHFGELGTPDKYKAPAGLKPKDLMMVPARFALAAQAEGWYVRSAIVWAKGISFCPEYAGSVMPESVKDRPTNSYEMVYLLAKSERYYYDSDAVREPNSTGSLARFGTNGEKTWNSINHKNTGQTGEKPSDAFSDYRLQNGRNLRSVWAINPQPTPLAHFACYPEALVDPIIRLATSQHGCCARCGSPWKRVVEVNGRKGYDWNKNNRNGGDRLQIDQSASESAPDITHTTIGWEPTCSCNCDDVIPPTVLDPFLGSGTTARVALRLGRKCIGVDLSEEYLEKLVTQRTNNVQIEMPL